MKILYGNIFCFIICIALSYFFPGMELSKGTASTLYTVSGIMFSIGMSLTVISSTSGVKNKSIRNKIRENKKIIRNNFIVCFLITTSLFVFIDPESLNTHDIILLRYPWILMIYIAYSILYFTWNFLSIQKLNEDIEEEIENERNRELKK